MAMRRISRVAGWLLLALPLLANLSACEKKAELPAAPPPFASPGVENPFGLEAFAAEPFAFAASSMAIGAFAWASGVRSCNHAKLTRMGQVACSPSNVGSQDLTPKSRASLTDIFADTTDVTSGAVAAYRSGRFTIRQIAAYIGVHYSTVRRLLARRDCKT